MEISISKNDWCPESQNVHLCLVWKPMISAVHRFWIYAYGLTFDLCQLACEQILLLYAHGAMVILHAALC